VAKFDWKSLSTRDQVAIGASAVALIALFLPWYGVSADGFSASVSGWSTSYGWLGAILIIAAGGLLVAHRAGADTSRLRTPWAKHATGPGAN
jgi:hypothetical protein